MTTTSSPPPETSSSRAAFWVGAGIFLSRIAGFARDALMSRLIGAGAVMDVWGEATKIPNVIQVLLGEGTLSASVIPVYAEMIEEGRDEDAGRFAGAALGLITVAAWSFALVGILASPVLAAAFFEFTAEQQALLGSLLRILFPMVAFIAMSAWALAILNSHRRFFVSYVAPAVWNLSMIAVLVSFGLMLGWSGAGRQTDLVIAVGWGALVGGALQLLVQLPWVRPVLRHFRVSVNRRVEGMAEAVRSFVPIVTARGIVSISGLVDMFIAHVLTSGAVAALYFAQRLYLLPVSLFGLSVAAAELPELSRRRKDEADVLADRVSQGLERVAFFVVPSAIAYLTIGDLIVATLYQGGRFGANQTALVGLVLGAYALGLPASAASRLLSSAYFAVRDTKTPAILSVIRMVLSAGVGIALMLPLDGLGVGEVRFGAVGLALGASLAAWLEYAVLRTRLRTHIGPHGPRGGSFGRILLAASIAGAAAFGVKWMLGVRFVVGAGAGGSSWSYSTVVLAGTGVLFGVLYLVLTSQLGVATPLRALEKR